MTPLTIHTLADDPGTGNKVVSDVRLWLTADRKRLVEDGDPDARFLYCNPGKPVNRDEFEGLGGKIKKSRKRDAPAEDKADTEGAEDKGDDGDDDYHEWGVTDLREELRDRDLPVSGNKKVLVERLRDDDAGA